MTKDILDHIIQEHPKATRDELDKLYTAALRDDPDAAQQVLQTVFDDMMAFDSDRTAAVIKLMSEDRSAGKNAFVILLMDMRRH